MLRLKAYMSAGKECVYLHLKMSSGIAAINDLTYFSAPPNEHRMLISAFLSQRATNRLVAHVRTGPNRTTEDYNCLMSSLVQAWADIVGNTGNQELRVVFVLGFVSGYEAGFAFPPAGEDTKWLKENYKEFEDRASLAMTIFRTCCVR